MSETKWTAATPRTSGYYEVLMDASAWGVDANRRPRSRIAHVDVESGRFDAGEFGGDIDADLWRWRGPIRVPDVYPSLSK